MRRLIGGLTTLLLFTACADQGEPDPCLMRVDVISAPATQVGATRLVEADVVVRSGVCSNLDKEIEWASSKSDIAEITATTDPNPTVATATVAARRAGTAYIVMNLVRTPAVRDSILFTVTPPVDN